MQGVWQGLGSALIVIGSVAAAACSGDKNEVPGNAGGASGTGASGGSGGKGGSSSGSSGSSTGGTATAGKGGSSAGSSGSSAGGSSGSGGSGGNGGAAGTSTQAGGAAGNATGGDFGAGGEAGGSGTAGAAGGGGTAGGVAGSGGQGGSAGNGGVEYRACDLITALTRYAVFRIDRENSTCTEIVLVEGLGSCPSGVMSGDWCLQQARLSADVTACEQMETPTSPVMASDITGTISVGPSINIDVDLTFQNSGDLPEMVSFDVTACTADCMPNDCRD
jgi:hypothetical protein